MSYKLPYLETLLESGVLRFGEFKTKSGRLSPYFFNTGLLDSGHRLGKVAGFYADAISERFGSAGVENLFGPAYKGIPLAVMTAERLGARLGKDVSFTFNRKEAKDHGEGGNLVGRAYKGGEKVVIIEDVITGGTSFRETFPILRAAKVDVVGFVVGIDRQEKGGTPGAVVSAMREVEDTYGVPGLALLDLSEIVAILTKAPVLGKRWIDADLKARIDAYRAQYGA